METIAVNGGLKDCCEKCLTEVFLLDPKMYCHDCKAACCVAKKVAANQEVCKELADAGAVNTTMQVRTGI